MWYLQTPPIQILSIERLGKATFGAGLQRSPLHTYGKRAELVVSPVPIVPRSCAEMPDSVLAVVEQFNDEPRKPVCENA